MLEVTCVSEALGGKKILGKEIRSGLELADLVYLGFPIAAAEHVLEKNLLTKQEIFQLIVSQRTYDRRKKNHRLSADESDKLARFVRIHAMVTALLGEEADAWLREPNPALGGKIPLHYMSSDSGSQMIESLLGRIAHGIPS